jgi:hypothetical protein
LALRDDESGDTQLKPLRARREEAERYQCLGDRFRGIPARLLSLG